MEKRIITTEKKYEDPDFTSKSYSSQTFPYIKKKSYLSAMEFSALLYKQVNYYNAKISL